MNEHNAKTFTNLRMLGMVKQNQYIETSSNYNIKNIVDSSLVNNVYFTLSYNKWSDTYACLHKTYEKDLKKIVDENLRDNNIKAIEALYKLLCDAEKGLEALKTVWNSSMQIAHLDTFIENFSKNYINRISNHMPSENTEN